MYVLYPMHAVAEDEKTHNKKLDKQDNNAFLAKLQQFDCCTLRCLLNVNPQAALKRFQEMKALIPSKSNLCFLGINDASMHATEFKYGTPKAYLTTKYKFEGVPICQKAWYTIYDIQKRQ
ncbi:hypothetical protein C2G38_2176961 [Gigaspora rosea]|uniref:Uncharacterized protein n=1 Tax=Gigaspora rosea TaxID=44941 RepID=A0A397VFU0_9GLOM|nr:hypothetical protein C2G38_2176961 [Gigaspora rosea]